jgi:hypothetical protein
MSNIKVLGDGTQVELLDGIIPELLKGLSGSQISKNLSQPVLSNNFFKDQQKSLTDATKNPVIGKIKSSMPKAELTGAAKVANSGFGKAMGNSSITGAANNVLKSAGSLFHSNRTGLQKTDDSALKIRDAQYSVLKSIPVTAPFAAAAELLDNTLGAITGGLGSATKSDKALSAIPLVGNVASIFAGKTDTFKGDIKNINTGDFAGVVSDANRAKEISGVKSVQAGKLNKQIRAAQSDFNLTTNIVDINKIRKNNNVASDYTSRNLNKYQGNQQLTIAKNGIKFPELENARNILNSIKSKDIQSFKSGGKIEKENIIPTGALHKNLHHIDDIGIDITKKGIPVVTMDEGGEFKEQIAEVEAAEWTLSLDVTKQIEEYWNNYKESGDDNISIECGKYLVDQIFNNTRDDDKVIKKTE